MRGRIQDGPHDRPSQAAGLIDMEMTGGAGASNGKDEAYAQKNRTKEVNKHDDCSNLKLTCQLH